MNNLATVHKVDVKKIWDLYTPGDYFAWDWLHDPLTMGMLYIWVHIESTGQTLLIIIQVHSRSLGHKSFQTASTRRLRHLRHRTSSSLPEKRQVPATRKHLPS